MEEVSGEWEERREWKFGLVFFSNEIKIPPFSLFL